MARTAGPTTVICKQFILDNPTSTFKNFHEAHPEIEMAPTYFSVIKSTLKKNGELDEVEKPKKAKVAAKAPKAEKVEKAAPVKAKASKSEKTVMPMPAPTLKAPKAKAAAAPKAEDNGNGRKKKAAEPIQETMKGNKAYLGWLETGLAKGYVEKLRNHM